MLKLILLSSHGNKTPAQIPATKGIISKPSQDHSKSATCIRKSSHKISTSYDKMKCWILKSVLGKMLQSHCGNIKKNKRTNFISSKITEMIPGWCGKSFLMECLMWTVDLEQSQHWTLSRLHADISEFLNMWSTGSHAKDERFVKCTLYHEINKNHSKINKKHWHWCH